jgi:hypothetical protein
MALGDGKVVIAGCPAPAPACGRAGRQGHAQLAIAAIYRLFISAKRKASVWRLALYC